MEQTPELERCTNYAGGMLNPLAESANGSLAV